MAKNTIKLMNSFTGQIVAGRVNPKTNMFVGDKEVVTESAYEHMISGWYSGAYWIRVKQAILDVESCQ